MTRPRTRTRSCARHRRAFALPLVLLLALATSLAIGVILMRNGASDAAVHQQIKSYERHHRHAGMKEMVDRWLATTQGSLADQLESDGQAFTIDLPRSGRIRVAITDGQGTLLDDLRGIYGLDARITTMAMDELRRRAGYSPLNATDGVGSGGDMPPEVANEFFRKAGPAAVSINSARPAVVEAVTKAIVPGNGGERLAAEYISRRNRALLTVADIRSIAIEAKATNDEAALLQKMFTAMPAVWKVEVAETIRNRVVHRSVGLIEIINDPNAGSTIGIGSRTRFLTWEDQPVP